MEKRYRFTRGTGLWETPSDPLYMDQWHLQMGDYANLNVQKMYSLGLTGSGIYVAVVDDGVQYDHPDLKAAYRAIGSWDFNDNDPDPYPISKHVHGTSVAGVVSARDNGICGVGVAYRSWLSGIRIMGGPTTDFMESMALSHRTDINSIFVSSWGPLDDGGRLDGPGFLTVAAMEKSVIQGRNGLGTIYVWAAGNGGTKLDNCNYDGYANSRLVITVASCDSTGVHASYSEKCSNLLITAPSSKSQGVKPIITTQFSTDGQCNKNFGGTSSSAPMVGGVIALILQANPNLTWRDIQHILIYSAKHNDETDPEWVKNGAGLYVSHKYGYGLIDTEAAVDLALKWKPMNPYVAIETISISPNSTIEPFKTLISTLPPVHKDIIVEHLEITVSIQHENRGQLEIELVSPSDTKSILAELHNDIHPDYSSWRFGSKRCIGEHSIGDWSLKIVNHDPRPGILLNWNLNIYGHQNT
eukprot:gene599-746_t